MDRGFQNTIFKLAQIGISATKALKFHRTSGSKQHNINFHVLFDYAPGITCFLSSWTVQWYTNKASIESILFVDSKNIFFTPWKFKFLHQWPWNSIEHQVRNSIILTFTSFSITQLENLHFISTHGLVLHEWGIGRKLMDRGFQKYNFQAGPNSFLCYKGLKIR
jgi:hypothetical protein